MSIVNHFHEQRFDHGIPTGLHLHRSRHTTLARSPTSSLTVIDTGSVKSVEVERRYGRPIISAFHGFWSMGGAVGGVLTAVMRGSRSFIRRALS